MTPPTDPRYPIGRFSPSATPPDRASNIDTIRRLPERMRAAITGLNDAQLDTPYREGGWTIRQVVHHVADSHANAYIRFKLALTEDAPIIKPYDEAAWAKLIDSRLPVEISLSLLHALHTRWAVLLLSLTDSNFERTYIHPENGQQDLATVLAMYDWHSRHHTAHITTLRERMGW